MRSPGRKTLAGVIGSTIGAIALFTSTPAEESSRTVEAKISPAGAVELRHVAGPQYLTAYLDIVQVPTICDGITKGVKLGQRRTPAECAVLLEDALVAHAEEVIACVPQLYGRDWQAPAAVSLAYNVGGPRFCGSSAAKLFRARRWREGCEALLLWNRAGGRVVRGLALRRERERQTCLTGLMPGLTPANMAVRVKAVR